MILENNKDGLERILNKKIINFLFILFKTIMKVRINV